ncbi:MAG: class I SAM-dependent methyltransferase [Candidatus Dormibacteria bacterium]
MVDSDLYADDHHWGDRRVNVRAHDLPALKVRYLLARLPTTGRVLEVGCGGGRLLNTVAAYRPRLELHGCDIRPLRYDPANFRFTLVGLGTTVLPYDPASFDAVIMMDALEHFRDPAGALHAARAVLRPRGRLVSFTPLEGQRLSFYRLFRRVLGDDLYVRTKEHVQSFSETDLRRLVGEDFDVVDHAYAYHVLGHLMDATLFALLASPRLRRRFWRVNPFYVEEAAGSAGVGAHSPLADALRVANALAFVESRALRGVSWGAAGIFFTAIVR